MRVGTEGGEGDGATRPQGRVAGATAEELRRRAAVELAARHSPALKLVAQRYSLCTADAEDAYQRTLEILLTKAPVDAGRDLIAWSKTVVKHEALAIRRNRERLLGTAPVAADEERDPIALIPGSEPGPDERLERNEEIGRSREALRTLKPAELRALTLLGEGYTYAEIGEITGFSRTKINRCLAEGRERFRRFVARSEDGQRCREMGLLLSRFCDGESSEKEKATVSEHLRTCAACRAAVRTYRTAPARIAALAPALPALSASRSLLERAQEALLGLQARVAGFGGDASAAALTGSRGAGTAALAKLLAVCAGTVGGAAACVATGVVPPPPELAQDRAAAPRIERVAERVVEASAPADPERPAPTSAPERAPVAPERAADPDGGAPPEVEAGAVEYPEAPAPAPEAPAPTPAVAPPPPPAPAPTPAGNAAGEFGP